MVDKEDGTIIETSLREMEEELGIPPGEHMAEPYSDINDKLPGDWLTACHPDWLS